MADSFKLQAMALTGLTIDGSSTAPSQTEFSQFLNDGVVEVTNRCIQLKPALIEDFTRQSTEQTSNGFNPGTSKILSVLRESGTNGEWIPCEKTSFDLQWRVTDPTSLHYASKYNPVFLVTQNRNVHVYPEPSSAGNDGFKVLYINFSPEETDGSALDKDSTGIKWFPDDKVYLVALYASIKSLEADLSNLQKVDLPTLPTSFVPPALPTGVNIDYSELGTIDTFNTPLLTMTDAPSISAFTISAITPVPPTISSTTITAVTSGFPVYNTPIFEVTAPPSLTSLIIQDVPPISTNVVKRIVNFTTEAPVFSPPVMGHLDFSDTNNWIITEEDPEMLNARITEIGIKIQEYSARLQEASETFKGQSQEYQTEFQRAIKNADLTQQGISAEVQQYAQQVQSYAASIQKQVNVHQQNTTFLMQQWQKEVDRDVGLYGQRIQIANGELQKDMQNFQVSINHILNQPQLVDQANKNIIQRYGTEVQGFGAQVQKEVQVYTTNMTRELQLWQVKRQTELQKYATDLQVESGRVGSSVQNFNIKMQKAIQTYQLETGQDLALYNGDLQAAFQGHQVELALFDKAIQRISTDYQWGMARMQKLISQYNGAFSFIAGASQARQQQQQQQGRR